VVGGMVSRARRLAGVLLAAAALLLGCRTTPPPPDCPGRLVAQLNEDGLWGCYQP
jgi:hypothetical protein